MRALEERGEQIARDAADRRMDELAKRMAAMLPKAEIKLLASGISIRDRMLLERWLTDSELRFVTRSVR